MRRTTVVRRCRNLEELSRKTLDLQRAIVACHRTGTLFESAYVATLARAALVCSPDRETNSATVQECPAAARTLVSQLSHTSKGHHSNWPPAPLLLSCWASRWPIMVVASRYRFEQLERQLLSELLSRVPGLEMHFSKQSAVTLSATFHKPRLHAAGRHRRRSAGARVPSETAPAATLAAQISRGRLAPEVRRRPYHLVRKHRRVGVRDTDTTPGYCTYGLQCEKTQWF